MKAASGKTWWV